LGFGKPQRTQRKKQLSVPFVSSVVNLLCHNSATQKKLKNHGIKGKKAIKSFVKAEKGFRMLGRFMAMSETPVRVDVWICLIRRGRG